MVHGVYNSSFTELNQNKHKILKIAHFHTVCLDSTILNILYFQSIRNFGQARFQGIPNHFKKAEFDISFIHCMNH